MLVRPVWFAPANPANDMETMVIRPKQLLLAITFTFAALGVSTANNVYLSQTAQGTGTGADCNDALAASYFNSSSNWTSSSPTGIEIGPGTTVHLCNTITSILSFQGSGVNGSPIVLDGAGATMSNNIQIFGKSYATLQNLDWSTSFVSDNPAIWLNGASYITIQNNTIDIGNTVSSSDDSLLRPGKMVQLDHGLGQGTNITIQNNFFRNAATTSPHQIDMIDAEGAAYVTIQGNYFETRVQDDSTCAVTGNCHDDQVQTFDIPNGAQNWTIRYNEFVMNTTANSNRSYFMLQGIQAGYFDIYSNLFVGLQGAHSANGLDLGAGCGQSYCSGQGAVAMHVYGNTVVEKTGGPACNIGVAIGANGTIDLENNVVYVSDASALCPSNPPAGVAKSNNLWYNAGSGSIPSCGSGEICGQNPLFTNYASDDFSLQSGSPAIGLGINLGTSYNQYPLPGSTWPNPTLGTRPSTGAWYAGAYDANAASGGGGGPTPPAGLTATVQ